MRHLAVLALGAAVLFTTGCKGLRSSGADGGTSVGGGLMSALASLVGFEGEIDFAITMPGLAGLGPSTGAGASGPGTTLKMKGDKMRMELGGAGTLAPGAGGGATIIDGAAKKSYTLLPGTKQYLETDLSALSKPTSPTPGTPRTKATNTGRTAIVAGYSCDLWTITSPGSKVDSEICVAHGLTFLAMGVGPFAALGGSGDAWGEALNGGGFPLRMRVFDSPGHEMMRLEATRVEKKSEPDSLFEIPAGYTKYTTTPFATSYGPTGLPKR